MEESKESQRAAQVNGTKNMRKLNTAVPIQNQVKTVVSTKTCQVKEKGFNCFLSRSPESANHISGNYFKDSVSPSL